ncbi:hypothetical protein llap_6302 [Limosa lapponica baueri]|uniref:Uncharacterized protein n=1 Tax=Limosa lapponica baueri TaxID=1758121 RepID=A0A2I0UBF1_LIMLA|nr:hypothetical protein llap_6302 [Limosa lapponica baueri]
MANGLSVPSHNAKAERNDSETQRNDYGHAKKKTPTCGYVLKERKEGLEREKEVSDLPKRIRMKREGSVPYATPSAYLNVRKGYFEGEKENKSISVNMMVNFEMTNAIPKGVAET